MKELRAHLAWKQFALAHEAGVTLRTIERLEAGERMSDETLVIGEVVRDPEQRWRALGLASVGAAIASEAVWTHRLTKERQKDEETHAALASCSARSR